ncbi:MAG: hypothetical protein B7Z14_14970 [Bosea sp. 32-68-6]|nr:MAG: hypothetical protein B7Z14_14970 [Bosea sp. 32-68-6]
MITGETCTWAELDELVPLVADFYARHGRDATDPEYRVLLMLARANAAANAEIAGRVECSPARPGNEGAG